jgi:hypothetical protein
MDDKKYSLGGAVDKFFNMIISQDYQMSTVSKEILLIDFNLLLFWNYGCSALVYTLRSLSRF